MKLALLFIVTLVMAYEDAPLAAKFIIGSVYDTETKWGGDSYLVSVQILCTRYLDPMPLRSPWSSTVSPNIIHIHNCTLPTVPLAEAFGKLDFDIVRMDKLRLSEVNLPTAIPENYTAGLFMTRLELSKVSNLTVNFFTSLMYLYKMTVENMEMPPLSPTPANVFHAVANGRLIELDLRNATVKKMANCEFIEDLGVANMEPYQISDWPEGCGGMLRTLRLDSMSPEAVRRVATIRPSLFIQSLSVRNCSLVELPLLLMRGFDGAGGRLFIVSLPYNNLEDKAFSQLSRYPAIGYLDLSYNRLNGECLRKILPNVGAYANSLNKFILDGNNITEIFDDYEIKTALANQPALSHLSLNWMQLQPDCLRHTRFKWLTNLGLASNSSKSVEILQLHHLPSTGSKLLTVNLRGHSARSVVLGPNFTENFENVTQADHWLTNKGYKLIVLLDFVDCDCNNDVLQLALKQFPEHLSMPGLKCNSKDGGFFLEEPIEHLSCRKATVNGCKRKLSRDKNYTTVVDCSNVTEKFRWPRPQRFLGLNAAGNGITTLHNAYLPDSLEWLDLRYNKIFNLTASDQTKLFGSKKRRLWLAGNPFSCTCDNRQLLEALQNNKPQIVDYEGLECYENRPLNLVKDVSIFELCKSGYSDTDLDFVTDLPKQRPEEIIFCSGPLEEEKRFASRMTFSTLTLDKCTLSMLRLDEVLESLNINVGSLRTLCLHDVVMPKNLERHYSAGLSLRNVELVNIQDFPFNFFSHLGGLRRLTVEKMVVPPLPPSNILPLFKMTLINSTVRIWDNCIHLQTLQMISLDQQQIPQMWPANCGGLRYLLLKNMTQAAVDHAIVTTNGTSLRELSINYCSLVDSPLRLMQNLDRLEILNLSHNELEDEAFLQIPDLKNLIKLNLAHNKLKGEFLIEMIPKMPKIRDLILDGNNFVHIFQKIEIKSAITTLKFLKSLSLNDMTFDADCLMYSNFSALEYLGLRASEKQKILLKLHALPRTGAANLKVDLSGRSYRSVEIDYDFYEDFDKLNTANFWITSKGYNLIVMLDYIDCVCNNDVLYTTLRDFSRFLSMPGLRCDSKDGPLFEEESLEKLNCLKATVHGCKRRISRDFEYITMVDCSYNKEKFRWPRPDKVYRSLNATGNHITSLHNAFLPETLQRLDLRNNDISRLDGNQSALLFNSLGRRVWLSGNPIVCHCDNQFLLNALRTNHSQIMDYDELKCADSGQLIRLVSIEELCRLKLEFVWGTGIVLAILSLFAALLLRHYWISLRIYLYARGYCISCLHEEDMDEDRPYDAFLSFAHGDNQYVLEELLPQLEGEPNFYRVCVHYRDWAVGEWIPAQIMQSVRLSKRTIIVLSQNFVTSLWGSMEFRQALASMESEGRSRLLVLVLDDVLSENLSPELRSYLSLNTYLKCDDPWFWEKLRFAMPRTQRNPQEGNCSGIVNAAHSELLSMDVLQTTNDANQSNTNARDGNGFDLGLESNTP